MLWKLTTTNKYGNLRSRIVHSNGPLTIGQGFGPFVGASLFRYQSKKTLFRYIQIPSRMVNIILLLIGLR
jgi:hypothetical protein